MVIINPMSEQRTKRVIVDPAVRQAEHAFQRMFARLKSMTREERLAMEIKQGLRNEDGSPKLPEEPPYLSGG